MPLGLGVLVPLAFYASRAAIIIGLVLLPTGIASALIRRIAPCRNVCSGVPEDWSAIDPRFVDPPRSSTCPRRPASP